VDSIQELVRLVKSLLDGFGAGRGCRRCGRSRICDPAGVGLSTFDFLARFLNSLQVGEGTVEGALKATFIALESGEGFKGHVQD